MSGCCCVTTTTVGPYLCPPGYEPCGSSGGLFILDSDCDWTWVNDDGCPQGCNAFWKTWPFLGENDCGISFFPGDMSTDGVCCKPVAKECLCDLAPPVGPANEGDVMQGPCSEFINGIRVGPCPPEVFCSWAFIQGGWIEGKCRSS